MSDKHKATTRVRFTKDHAAHGKTHKAGLETDLPHDHARSAIDQGAAEEVRPDTRGERGTASGPAPEGAEDKMRVRFRHDYTVDGKGYLAGSAALVDQSDEAWAAVNDGHADLDPPPGIANQPFPPEHVRRSPATDVVATAADTARLTTHHGKGKDEK
jgi:hypothetical protein